MDVPAPAVIVFDSLTHVTKVAGTVDAYWARKILVSNQNTRLKRPKQNFEKHLEFMQMLSAIQRDIAFNQRRVYTSQDKVQSLSRKLH